MKAYFYNNNTCTRVKLYGNDVIELFKINGGKIVEKAKKQIIFLLIPVVF